MNYFSRLFVILLILPVFSITASEVELAAQRLIAKGGSLKQGDEGVFEISFRDSSQLGEAAWKSIGTLTSCRKLTVYGGARGLNDETVQHLVKLQNLEALQIDGAQLTDVGLAKMAAMSSLKSVSFFHLSFRMEGFTGKGFTAWKDLPNLEQLTVAGMSMGDEGFEAISQIQSLKSFRTWHTHRSERSNSLIAKLPKLTSLRLGQRMPHANQSGSSLSDASIPTLLTMKSLESLEIGEADFSVDALLALKDLPNLKRLKSTTPI